jgi:aspartate kinase
VTTLGRGGSDTTAVALAAALEAEACEIYSDVDGVFSADPRVVPEARKLAELSYDEMQSLASAGAKVLNAQAVQFAKDKGIVIHARSSFGGGTGSQVRELPAHPASRVVKAVAGEPELAVLSCEGGATVLAELLDFLQPRGAVPRVLSFDSGAPASYLVVPLQDAHGLESLEKDVQLRFAGKARLELSLGSITCVGTGVSGAEAQRALLAAEHLGIEIRAVHLTPLQLCLLVPRDRLHELTQRLHREFLQASPP